MYSSFKPSTSTELEGSQCCISGKCVKNYLQSHLPSFLASFSTCLFLSFIPNPYPPSDLKNWLLWLHLWHKLFQSYDKIFCNEVLLHFTEYVCYKIQGSKMLHLVVMHLISFSHCLVGKRARIAMSFPLNRGATDFRKTLDSASTTPRIPS